MQTYQIRRSCSRKCRSYTSDDKSKTLSTPKKLMFTSIFECYKDISSIKTKLSLLGTRLNFCLVLMLITN